VVTAVAKMVRLKEGKVERMLKCLSRVCIEDPEREQVRLEAEEIKKGTQSISIDGVVTFQVQHGKDKKKQPTSTAIGIPSLWIG
ncbi:unnamed protein product, partial [Prorocentrum cordatum]